MEFICLEFTKYNINYAYNIYVHITMHGIHTLCNIKCMHMNTFLYTIYILYETTILFYPIYKPFTQYTKYFQNIQNIYTIYKIFTQYTKYLHNIQNIYTIYKIFTQYTKYLHNIQNIYTLLLLFEQYA